MDAFKALCLVDRTVIHGGVSRRLVGLCKFQGDWIALLEIDECARDEVPLSEVRPG